MVATTTKSLVYHTRAIAQTNTRHLTFQSTVKGRHDRPSSNNPLLVVYLAELSSLLYSSSLLRSKKHKAIQKSSPAKIESKYLARRRKSARLSWQKKKSGRRQVPVTSSPLPSVDVASSSESDGLSWL